MSNPEEFILNNGDPRKLDFINTSEREYVAELIKAYTNKILHELKDRLIKKIEYQHDVVLKDCKWMGYDHQQATCKIECYEELIILIEELQDE